MLMSPISSSAPALAALKDFLKTAKSGRLVGAERALIAAREERKQISVELGNAVVAAKADPHPRRAKALDDLDQQLIGADKKIAAALATLEAERTRFAAELRQQVKTFLSPAAATILCAVETIERSFPLFLAVQKFETDHALFAERPLIETFPNLAPLRTMAERCS